MIVILNCLFTVIVSIFGSFGTKDTTFQGAFIGLLALSGFTLMVVLRVFIEYILKYCQCINIIKKNNFKNINSCCMKINYIFYYFICLVIPNDSNYRLILLLKSVKLTIKAYLLGPLEKLSYICYFYVFFLLFVLLFFFSFFVFFCVWWVWVCVFLFCRYFSDCA